MLCNDNRDSNQHQRRQEQVLQRVCERNLPQYRLSLKHKLKAVLQIAESRNKNIAACLLFLKWNMNKNLHNCRKQEAARAYVQNRHQPYNREQNAANHRPSHIGQGADHIDQRIRLHQMACIHQNRHTRLHCRLIRPLYPIQNHHGNRHERHNINRSRHHIKKDD